MAFQPGFDLGEAKALLTLICDLQGASPPLPQPAVPESWRKVFDPPPIGNFDNKWQLWQDTTAANRYAVVVRGTTYAIGSIGEDLMLGMVAARGELPVDGRKVGYKLADEPKAAVHLGFLVGALLLLADRDSGILAKLAALPEGSDIYIIGHSQGAAIATLCRAFLHYAAPLQGKGFNHKLYVFAQPKPGNGHFGDDFERAVGIDHAFRITNDQDWAPQGPLTVQKLSDFNEPNPLDLLKKGCVGWLLKTLGFLQRLLTRRRGGLEAKLAHLEKMLVDDGLLLATPATGREAIAFVPTLNYEGCGTEIVRAGTPGRNPIDPDDYLWQHHAALYYLLLSGEKPPV